MRRIVLILPEWLAADEGGSVVRQKLGALESLAELGELFRLATLPKVDTPEAIYLGIAPEKVRLRQGPLTVSALGADPPERSTHFHLSLAGLVEGKIVLSDLELPAEQVDKVMSLAAKLNTSTLTIVNGFGKDHGLVWEGRGDMATTAVDEGHGKALNDVLPEGDAEKPLRRLIDDSANLLSELELNEERIDQGLPPLNLLWPWGHGERVPVPNLVFERGERADVYSGSLRLAGLTRLTGYRHADRFSFGRGVRTRLDWIAQEVLRGELSVVVMDAFAELRQKELLEEAEWLSREVNDKLLATIFNEALVTPTRLTLLSPSFEHSGLGLQFQTKMQGQNVLPFDERALEERQLPVRGVADVVAEALKPSGLL